MISSWRVQKMCFHTFCWKNFTPLFSVPISCHIRKQAPDCRRCRVSNTMGSHLINFWVRKLRKAPTELLILSKNNPGCPGSQTFRENHFHMNWIDRLFGLYWSFCIRTPIILGKFKKRNFQEEKNFLEDMSAVLTVVNNLTPFSKGINL